MERGSDFHAHTTVTIGVIFSPDFVIKVKLEIDFFMKIIPKIQYK